MSVVGHTRKMSPWFCLVRFCGIAVGRARDVNDGRVSVAAGQKLRNPPFDQISAQ